MRMNNDTTYRFPVKDRVEVCAVGSFLLAVPTPVLFS